SAKIETHPIPTKSFLRFFRENSVKAKNYSPARQQTNHRPLPRAMAKGDQRKAGGLMISTGRWQGGTTETGPKDTTQRPCAATGTAVRSPMRAAGPSGGGACRLEEQGAEGKIIGIREGAKSVSCIKYT
ncbi:hypothetical protein OCK74_26580, partial [Chitinophagaceae bacterium LB-8]